MRYMRIPSAVFSCLLAALAGLPLHAQPPEIRARIDAYVKALSSGSPDEFETMARENFTPELLDRTATQRRPMVTRVHDDFGAISIANEQMTTAGHVELEIASRKNSMPLSIAIDFEPNTPFRIA